MADVLLHTLVFSPDGVSTAYLMTDLARELARRGHHVEVLTTTPHYNADPSQLERQPLRRFWGQRIQRSECDEITVWHIRMPSKGAKVGQRMLDFIVFHAWSIAFATVHRIPADVVITPSPPLTIGAVAWLIARMRGAAAVYNVQEIYPDFAVNQGVLSSRPLIAFLRWLERFVYDRSDAVTVISERFAQIVRGRTRRPDRVHVIPNFVDARALTPGEPDADLGRELALEGQFVVYYGGNLGLSIDFESLLFAAGRLRDRPVTFVVTGSGVRASWFEAELARRNLTNVRLLGYQPQARMPQFYRVCDLGIIPMLPGTTTDTFPSKVYTYMAYAQPVLASAEPLSDLAAMIEAAGCGFVVPPGDPEAFLRGLESALEDRERLNRMGRAGREFVVREHSLEAVADRYESLIAGFTR